jgi:hypothetical protein
VQRDGILRPFGAQNDERKAAARAASRYAAGVYLIAPFRNPAEILHLLDEEDG